MECVRFSCRRGPADILGDLGPVRRRAGAESVGGTHRNPHLRQAGVRARAGHDRGDLRHRQAPCRPLQTPHMAPSAPLDNGNLAGRFSDARVYCIWGALSLCWELAALRDMLSPEQRGSLSPFTAGSISKCGFCAQVACASFEFDFVLGDGDA